MAESIRFFPMEITYRIVDGKAIINIYGKNQSGEQICVIDRNFEPYFYAVPKSIAEVEEKLKKVRVEDENGAAFVEKTEKTIKKYLGKEIMALKVFTNLPGSVPKIREAIKGWDIIESTYEFDIQFVRRYLIDKNITLFTLYECEGSFSSNSKSRVLVFDASSIKLVENDTMQNPKVLAFDIETYTPLDFEINMEKNPILMLSFYGDNFKKVIVWKKFRTENKDIEFVESESDLIVKFKEIVENYRPDIITGYFSDGFDFPYIKTRAAKYKIKMDIGLDFSEIKQKQGRESAIGITGITHLDIFKFIKKVMGSTMETYTYDLNSVASELLNEKKHDVNPMELPHAWDNENSELEKFANYCLHDSYLTYNLAIKMMPTIIEMVKIVGLPIYDINRMGFSQLVEWYAMKQTLYFNEIAPNRPGNHELDLRRMSSYEGGFVFEPKPGLYKDIVVFDFKSLYPTIIGGHNIDLGTLNCECCKNSAKRIEVENKSYWFCEKKRGFIPVLIEDLITRRTRIKEIMKQGKTEEHSFLEARSNALKLLANSFYGYLGFFGARWYSLECATSVTAWGRKYIQQVIGKSQANGFNVLYSDTDSIFIALEGKTEEDARNFVLEINKELPGLMELDFENYYSSGIFVGAKMGPYGAKKKYALISRSGKMKIRGFETVRRNWSPIAKDSQERVLNIVLREHDPKKALDYIKDIIRSIKEKKVPVSEVIIHTQLQKEILDYASKGPHVAAAQRMKNMGRSIGPGSMIKYVVTSGSDSISSRVKLPEEIKEKDYDSDYYINHQVVPAVERIFNVLGYTQEDLTESHKQTKLGGFF